MKTPLLPIFPTDAKARFMAQKAATAKDRAIIALRMLASGMVWSDGYERAFDDAFEMGDGDEVVRIIVEMADSDPDVEALFNPSAMLSRSNLDRWRAVVIDQKLAAPQMELAFA